MPVGIAVLWFGFYTYLNIIDPPLYDTYPQDSKKNEFTLYNDGCCFVLEDFSIWLSDESGAEYPLFENAAPPYGKRLIADFPQGISGSVQATVSFRYEYGTVGYAEFPIMDFESLEALKNDGLLLIFGDGSLQVKSGNQEELFSYDKTPWASSADALRLETVIADFLPVFTFDISKIGESELLDTVQYAYQLVITCQEKPELISQTFQFNSLIDLREDLVSFADIDSDGYLDVQITYLTAQNITYEYYRWNVFDGEQYGQYETEPFFSLLCSSYRIMPETKQLLVTIANGIWPYMRELYQLSGTRNGGWLGKYNLIRFETTDWQFDGDGHISYTVHIFHGDNEVYTEVMTQDEYYNISSQRDTYLCYGTDEAITVETAHALLYEKYGETTEFSIDGGATIEYQLSFSFEEMKVINNVSCYSFRMSWLVDNNHWSFVDDIFVAPDGTIIMSDGSVFST